MSPNENPSANVPRLILLALACCIVSSAARAQSGQSVLYSVTTSEADSGIPIYKTQVFKTEIFAVDPETGKQRLVFSDASSPFFLMKGGIAAAGGRVFAAGILPVETAAHTPHFDPAAPAAIYELSMDGSGQSRKISDIRRGGQGVNCGTEFLNSSGSELGSINPIEGRFYLVVCDAATGNLVRKSELKYGPVERKGWRFGSVRRIGWMADDKRIFFTIELAGDSPEAWWTTPGSPVGTYVLAENSDTAERLAPEASLHPKIAGMQPSNDSAAVLIGTLPDGGYLFQDYEGDSRGAGGEYLYELDLTRKTQKIFPLQVDGNPGDFYLSQSGNRLVFTATENEYQKQPTFTATSTLSVWVLDLQSSKEWKVISFPPQNRTRPIGPWVNLIGWLASK
jgi:hypothetical protein